MDSEAALVLKSHLHPPIAAACEADMRRYLIDKLCILRAKSRSIFVEIIRLVSQGGEIPLRNERRVSGIRRLRLAVAVRLLVMLLVNLLAMAHATSPC